MIKSANHTSLSDFLLPQTVKEDGTAAADTNRIYTIPDFQRPYAWGEGLCETLFDDLWDYEGSDANDGYFLGSLIWVGGKDGNIIIDGQQRLTSLSLLLIALYERYRELGVSQQDERMVRLRAHLLTDKNKSKLALQEQNSNKEDYEYLMKIKCKNGSGNPPQKNFGNRHISRNYNRLEKLLGELTLQELDTLAKKVQRATFVCIEAVDSQSAYLLFECMNNRGLALSPIDLIKNKFIARGGAYNGWKQLIEKLGDSYADQEQFIRNNYNAFRAEYNGYEPLAILPADAKYAHGGKATKTNVIKIYDQLITNPDEFIETLSDRADLYHELLTADAFRDFRNGKATSAFPLLLYLYYYKNQFPLSDGEFDALCALVLRFFIRRNVTNTPGTGKIPQILMGIIEKINMSATKNYATIEAIVREAFLQESASDAVLCELLSGDMYIQNTDMTRYLLCLLAEEAQKDAKEARPDFWATDEKHKRYVFTIEHIFPEGENIPECWVNMIANGDPVLAKKHHGDWVHKLGNLTLTGYNSELSNADFETKKNKTDKNGLKIGYDNNLAFNRNILAQSAWTVDNIRERTAALVDLIMQHLSLA